ncbi:UxaA family hydrolase [Andreprevotia chitinilytica]|uniref:UxaA family hydrolase n=1 Tax=Andreprevotia chitinilytica TaxID=396808 RepID=UPI00055711B0|nr:UxaA family hydrolase [Andreprevotia chitinilytica]
MNGDTILALKIMACDSVATVLEDVKPSDAITVKDKAGNTSALLSKDAIPFGHKIATCQIKQGEEILKYGESLGVATRTIEPGEHVHTQNIDSQYGCGDVNEGASKVAHTRASRY